MRDIVKLGGILMLVCIIASWSLAGVNQLTMDKIAEQRTAKLENTIAQFFNGADQIEEITDEARASLGDILDNNTVQAVYRVAKKGSDKEIEGIVVKVAPRGFGGAIETLVGIGGDGVIAGVGVISSSETAGLGTKATKKDYLRQYEGKSDETDLKITRDGGEIIPITGATISSKAVSTGVSSAFAVFKEMEKSGLLNGMQRSDG